MEIGDCRIEGDEKHRLKSNKRGADADSDADTDDLLVTGIELLSEQHSSLEDQLLVWVQLTIDSNVLILKFGCPCTLK